MAADFLVRPMTVADVPEVERLTDEAGWRRTPVAWWLRRSACGGT